MDCELRGNGEWGMGNGERDAGTGIDERHTQTGSCNAEPVVSYVPVPRSPFPFPHSPFPIPRWFPFPVPSMPPPPGARS
jgi:hypothetical protein